jgi:Gpi18-like mannosyltransferase
VLLASPTVIANSSILGQCDTWHTAFNLGGLYALMRKRYCITLFWAGMAYAFKQQAMFIWPFLFIFVLNGKMSWKWLWIAPFTVFMTTIPAWLQGRDMMEMLLVYFHQAGTYGDYGNAPNLYWLMPLKFSTESLVACLIAAAMIAFSFSYSTAQRWQDHDHIVKVMLLATFSVALCPFILPKMLDRYFYMAEVFALLLIVMRPRWFLIPVLLHIATLFAYPNWHYPLIRKFIDVEWRTSSTVYGSVFTTIAIGMLLYLCYQHIWKRDPVPLPR